MEDDPRWKKPRGFINFRNVMIEMSFLIVFFTKEPSMCCSGALWKVLVIASE